MFPDPDKLADYVNNTLFDEWLGYADTWYYIEELETHEIVTCFTRYCLDVNVDLTSLDFIKAYPQIYHQRVKKWQLQNLLKNPNKL